MTKAEANRRVKRDLLKTALLGALAKQWDAKVAEWKEMIKKGERWIYQFDGVPYWWLGMSAAAAGRRVGIPAASARAYLWQLVREGKVGTADSIGEGYPTTLFFLVKE